MVIEIFLSIIGLYILYRIIKYLRRPRIRYKRQYRIKYLDKKGYKRYKDNDRLVHREIAWNNIYDFDKHPLRFREYDIHHKDRNKLNNKIKNLELLTRKQHKEIHGIK